MTMVAMILTAIGAWFLLSVLMTGACAAVMRGGVREDMIRGYVTDPR